jgi:hypothetical protein
MLKKLILIGLVILSGSSYSYDNDRYQQEMLRQQQEQTRIMQSQASNEFNAAADQQMYQDNMIRNQMYR